MVTAKLTIVLVKTLTPNQGQVVTAKMTTAPMKGVSLQTLRQEAEADECVVVAPGLPDAPGKTAQSGLSCGKWNGAYPARCGCHTGQHTTRGTRQTPLPAANYSSAVLERPALRQKDRGTCKP